MTQEKEIIDTFTSLTDSMSNICSEIDEKKIINNISSFLGKKKQIEFNKNNINQKKIQQKLKKIKNKKGLYVFYGKFENVNGDLINLWNSFCEEWDKSDIDYRPKIIKSRKEEVTFSKNQYIPLYVGKSNNLFQRIDQHIFYNTKKGATSKKTYALQLKNFLTKFNENFTIGCSYFVFADYNQKELVINAIHNNLLFILECKIRHKLICFIGKD